MPQMGPLSWILVFMFTTSIYILFLSFLYSFNLSEASFSSRPSCSSSLLIWQW